MTEATGTPFTVFPDTNFFLECRTPEECPWDQITAAREIRILVCRAVRREIDRWKNAGKGRKSDRARRLTSQLRNVSRQGNQPLLLRECNPRVTLEAAGIVAPLSAPPPELDRSYSDDAIILDILAQVAAASSLRPVFLTDDGNAADTARHVGLTAIDLPFDEPGRPRWRLDPEPDGVQRRLNEFERRLNGFMRQAPDLQVRFLRDGAASIHQLEVEAFRYTPLEPWQVDQLAAGIEARHPAAHQFAQPEFEPLPRGLDKVTVLGMRQMQVWNQKMLLEHGLVPSPEAITKYCEQDRPKWLEKIKCQLREAHWLLSLEHNQVAFGIRLVNAGTVPASSVMLRISGRGGSFMCLPPNECSVPASGRHNLVLRLPSPPPAPKPGLSGLAASLVGLNEFRVLPPQRPERQRDPHRFYWGHMHNGLAQHWEQECAEFRHQDQPQDVWLRLILGADAAIQGRCAVECVVQASNQAEPLSVTLPVMVNWHEGDTMQRVTELFRDATSVEFCDEGYENEWLPKA